MVLVIRPTFLFVSVELDRYGGNAHDTCVVQVILSCEPHDPSSFSVFELDRYEEKRHETTSRRSSQSCNTTGSHPR